MTERENSNPLPDALLHCGELWCASHAEDGDPAPLSRLSKRAVGDGGFFTRMADQKGVSTYTLERFARYLRDPANWPGGDVPADVCELAHRVGVTGESPALSTGQGGAMSGEVPVISERGAA